MVNKGAILIFGTMANTRGNFKSNLFGILRYRYFEFETIW
jgi:hypothetical protein